VKSKPHRAFMDYGVAKTFRPVALRLDMADIPTFLWYIHLSTIRKFNCCGYPFRNLNLGAFVVSSARNLALADSWIPDPS